MASAIDANAIAPHSSLSVFRYTGLLQLKPGTPQFFRQSASPLLICLFGLLVIRVFRIQQGLNTFDQIIGLQIELVAWFPLQKGSNLASMRDDHGTKTDRGFSATVRLTPSSATEPLPIMYFLNAGGTQTSRKRRSLVFPVSAGDIYRQYARSQMTT